MSKRPYILIVENSEFYRTAIGEALRSAGYETDEAVDGIEAINKITARPPDVVVLDIIMPRLDGEKLARYLKDNPKYRAIPLIVLSGVAQEAAEKLRAIGVRSIMPKSDLKELAKNVVAELAIILDESVDTGALDEIADSEPLDPAKTVEELFMVRAHYEAMIEQLGEGVIELDFEGTVLNMNSRAENMIGIEAYEKLGRNLTECFDPSFAEDLRSTLEQVCYSDSDQTAIIKATHDMAVLEMRIGLFRYPGQSETGILVSINDVTERELLSRSLEKYAGELEMRLRQIESTQQNLVLAEKAAATTKLIAGVAHELKNPLNSMNFTTLNLEYVIGLADEVGAAQEQANEHLTLLRSDIERMKRIIDEFMAFARPAETNPQLFDLKPLINEVLEQNRVAAQANNLTIHWKSDRELPGVLGFEGEIERAIGNLVSNAIEASEGGAVIDFESRLREDHMIVLTVANPGAEPPVTVRNKMYDMFFTTKEAGHGLGLAQVMYTATSHGGGIDYAYQDGMNVFTMVIPASAGETA